MTRTVKSLIKAKNLIEKKINLNNSLLEIIKDIKQDENTLREEIEAYKVALKLIKKKLNEEYKSIGGY